LTALYEVLPSPAEAQEEERQRLLEDRVMALIALEDSKKRNANFPKAAIQDGLIVPLAIASNRLSQLAAFRGLDNAERALWVQANAPAIGFTYLTAQEAKTRYGCNSELLRLEPEENV
jgi:hypothetical protein